MLAAGAETSYFGHDEWEPLAPGLKSIEDAVEIRRRIFRALEIAARTTDPVERQRALTFVVVGGGPTGVEMAGAIGEIVRDLIPREFHGISSDEACIVLVEGMDRILGTFPEKLSRRAAKDLERRGVVIRTGTLTTAIEPGVVWLGEERIAADTVIWAAGVSSSPIGRTLGVPVDRGGRVIVEPDLSVPGHPEIFVIGDLASATDAKGQPLPGIAPVALQAGEWAAANIRRLVAGEATLPFRYRDRGTMATVGRNHAVAVIFGVSVSGFPAWLLWAGVHVMSLIEFRNRAAVMFQWVWAYLTRQRSARLITGDESPVPVPPRRAALTRTPAQSEAGGVAPGDWATREPVRPDAVPASPAESADDASEA